MLRHIDTVLTPVYRELMELREGTYDITLVDSTIVNARKNDI